MLWIWLGFAAIAVVAVAGVVIAGGGSDNGLAAPVAGPVAADTSGSYTELVDRANGLYDQGITAFGKNDDAGGVEYFGAAAEVYRAAWKKQPGDPNVGTDRAVALFYSRHHDEALQQIDVVLKKNPDFQTGHLNRGIFLQTEASEAKDGGDAEKGADFLAQAKTALEKAVSLDPTSEVGKHAAEQLKSL
jgi:tetratricopeptide (TPR) repeat protein